MIENFEKSAHNWTIVTPESCKIKRPKIKFHNRTRVIMLSDQTKHRKENYYGTIK